jgi:hypothetical protein
VPGIKWEPDWEAHLPIKNSVYYEKNEVLISLPEIKPKRPEVPEPSLTKKRKKRVNNGKRGKKWHKPDTDKLIQLMEQRDLIELPMTIRAAKIKQMQPDPFPNRTTESLHQHYKQATTVETRTQARAEAMKPPTEPPPVWENTNARQEKYTIETPVYTGTGLIDIEKGKITKISALLTSKIDGKMTAMNCMPIEAYRLIGHLISQVETDLQLLQETPQ